MRAISKVAGRQKQPTQTQAPAVFAGDWAGVVSAFFAAVSVGVAAVALYYARQTVRESRDLRREERLARLTELVSEYGEKLIEVRVGANEPRKIPIVRMRLRNAFLDIGGPLPACEALLGFDWASVHGKSGWRRSTRSRGRRSKNSGNA